MRSGRCQNAQISPATMLAVISLPCSSRGNKYPRQPYSSPMAEAAARGMISTKFRMTCRTESPAQLKRPMQHR
jgi:hypothetical protein